MALGRAATAEEAVAPAAREISLANASTANF
jgi:hypothetical protein